MLRIHIKIIARLLRMRGYKLRIVQNDKCGWLVITHKNMFIEINEKYAMLFISPVINSAKNHLCRLISSGELTNPANPAMDYELVVNKIDHIIRQINPRIFEVQQLWCGVSRERSRIVKNFDVNMNSLRNEYSELVGKIIAPIEIKHTWSWAQDV
jgi:hypothetical protein